MYFVKYGESYLHDPRTDDCILLDLSFDSSENSCGYCDFKIYPNHPMYKKLRERDDDNPVEVYDGDILLFSGFIYDLGINFYLDGEVKCKGELEYLNDSIVRPYSTIKRGFGQTAPSTQNEYFVWLIEQHNAQVSPNKRFKIGINQASNVYSSVYIFRENDQYPTTMEEIKEKLLDNVNGGGYLQIRHENGERYIDYISKWTNTNTQKLEFGVNLTNYTQTDDSSEIYTYVIPLGARMSETEYEYNDGYFVTSDIVVDNNKTYYILNENGYYSECTDLTAFEHDVTYFEYDYESDESNQFLTVSGKPDGTYDEPGYIKSGDMIYCETSAQQYGFIGMKYENSEITTREELIEKGTLALKEKVSPKRTIEIKAVDMHLINPNIKPLRIGEYVRICSYPHNLDDYFLCRSIDLDLNNPENSTYILGTTYDTLTGQQNKQINALNASINSVYESAETTNHEVVKVVKSVSSTHEEAKKAMEESLAAKDVAIQATAKTELIESQVTEVAQNVNNVNTKAQEAIEKATASEAASGQASAIAEQIQNEINVVKGDANSLSDAIDLRVENSAKTATNYLNFSELGLIIGNMIAEELKKNILIADDSVNIRDGETVLAKFAGNAIEFAKQVVFKADNILLDNGDAFAHLGQNNILWFGAYHMDETQSITLSTNITQQLHGAVFAWSYYDGTSALDQDFTYFFVPKSHVINSPGGGVRMSDPYIGMVKYLHVSNGTVSGHVGNGSSGTMNGIAWNNGNYVLRYVIGV